MLPPACTTCGSPLPTVPADPSHPERCPACAARAVGAPGPTSVVPPPPHGGWGAGAAPVSAPLVVATRYVDGLLVGAAAAAIGGAIWWAIAASTERQIYFVAIAVGVIAGQGVLIGARRGGPLQGAMAAVLCLLSLVVAQYFVVRSIAISESHASIPLWQDFGFAKSVITNSVKADKLSLLFWALSMAAAAATAGLPSRRPAV